MVVLSVSICTRGGKALVSRQFVEMTRMRIEGLLAAFPKLVEHAKQHTFVETDTVRYVYQPLENHMFLLLITTKASNIVEDLSTLRLLAKVVPDVAGGLLESAINEHAFDLIFAFDEVIAAGGYREEATLSSIRTNLIMDSHEEKMHDMIEAQKKKAAEDRAREKAAQFQHQKVDALRQSMFNQNGPSMGAPGGMQGFGGGGYGNTGGDSFQGFGDSGFGNDNQFNSDPYASYNKPAVQEAPAAPRVPVKGMKLGGLGGSNKKDSLMAAFAAEDNIQLNKKSGDALGLSQSVAAPSAPPSAPVSLVIEEKLTVNMNRDGGIDSCDVKGTLTYTANTEQGSFATIGINKSVLSSQCRAGWNLSTHPKVNKQQYEKEGILALKDTKKGFPLNRPVGVFRWAYSSPDAAPITINCWPEDEGSGSINVNIEFELARSDMTLHDVNIVFPLGTTDPPAIESIDGVYKHDPRAGMICWHHDVVDANNSTGAMEFSIAGSDTEAFFPIQISFKSQNLLCPIEITNLSAIGSGASVPNTMTKMVTPESYQCA